MIATLSRQAAVASAVALLAKAKAILKEADCPHAADAADFAREAAEVCLYEGENYGNL